LAGLPVPAEAADGQGPRHRAGGASRIRVNSLADARRLPARHRLSLRRVAAVTGQLVACSCISDCWLCRSCAVVARFWSDIARAVCFSAQHRGCDAG
jgi:hypothetical protein